MIGGIVLAAGAGRRFGAPKQLASLDGRPLLEHALEAMAGAAPVDRMVVVLGAHAREIRSRCDLGDAEPLLCRRWEEGMAASLRTAVAELSEAEAVVVTLADQPGISAQAIVAVVDAAGGDEPAVRATYGGHPGHPVLLKRRLFGAVATLRGGSGARELLASVAVREVECGKISSPVDVDTPEQLEALR